jgi:uncharacterized protein YciI
MLASILFAAALATRVAQAAPTAPPAVAASPAPKMEFDAYQLVILQRPEHPIEYPQAELDRIQAAHLDHLRALAEAGKLLVAGPLDDQPDPRLRGIEVFKVGSLEEAKALAQDDPAVKAGRLEPVVMTWYTEKGALAFPVAERMRKP